MTTIAAQADPTIHIPLNKACLELYERFVQRGVLPTEAVRAAAQVYSGAGKGK